MIITVDIECVVCGARNEVITDLPTQIGKQWYSPLVGGEPEYRCPYCKYHLCGDVLPSAPMGRVHWNQGDHHG